MRRYLLASLCLILTAACSLAAEGLAPQTTASATPVAPTGTATATMPPTLTPRPAPPAIAPADIPNAIVVYYDIIGSTESELRAQLDALGPIGYDGYKGDATTKWFISWNWPGYGSDACDLSAATVSLMIDVIFPRWTPPENADADLVAKWANYTHLLAEHERGHVEFAAANYQSVADAIKAATCESAEAAAEAALAPIRQFDIDYDSETEHGAAQGARFP